MREYEVAWLAPARIELLEILSYIERDLNAPETAQQTAQKLLAAAASLARAPQRFPADAEIPEARVMVEGNYYLYYMIFEDAGRVDVLRLRHQLQQRLKKL